MTSLAFALAFALTATHAVVWVRGVWLEARCRDGQCARCWGSAWRLR